MKPLLTCCCLLLLALPASAETYTCKDDEGSLVFRESDKQPKDKSCEKLDDLTESEEQPETTRTKPPRKDWYVIDYNNKCKASEGPSALIKAIQGLKKIGPINSKVTDVKVEKGKPVIVQISANDSVSAIGNTFYRSKDLCKAATAKINKKNAAEVDRYK